MLTSYLINTIDDSSTEPDGLISLREAIIAANTNQAFLDAPAGQPGAEAIDTIRFAPSLSGGQINLSSLGAYLISDAISISDQNPQPISLNGQGLQRIFEIAPTTPSVTIANVVIQNGNAEFGGSIFVNAGANVSLENVVIINSSAENGGGIYNEGGSLLISGSTLTSNSASAASGSGGAIFSTQGQVSIRDSQLSFNRATRAGGAIEIVAGNLELTRSNFVNNDVDGLAGPANPGNGGALHVTSLATVSIDGGVFVGNRAGREGGALWNSSTGIMTIGGGAQFLQNVATGAAADDGGGAIFNNLGTLVITADDQPVSFVGNSASGASGSGGAIFSLGGSLSISGAILENNVANRAGGGIEIAGANQTANLSGVRMVNNNAGGAAPNPGNGGGIHLSGTANASIVRSEIRDNFASQEGGGLWNALGTMDVVESMVSGNVAGSASNAANDQGGGGLFNAGGTLNITDTSIIDNRATTNAGNGGGVMTDRGSLTINGGVIAGNQAARAGGGVENFFGTTNLINATVGGPTVSSSNSAGINGGGLHVSGTGTTMVNSGLFRNNVAGQEGGGLWNAVGTMTISRTSILDNVANAGNNSGNDQGGGGVFNAGGTVNISDATIRGNSAPSNLGNGGGVMTDRGTMSIARSTISNNSAVRAGGGIENFGGTVTLTSVTLGGTASSANSAGINGGGLHVSGMGNTNVIASSVSRNIAAREGGGLWNDAGIMTISGSTIDSNRASGALATNGGGGVFNVSGTLNISNAIITNNIANGAAGSGGGVMSRNGTVNLNFSNLITNSANRAGGAIEVIDGQLNLTFTNLTRNDVNGTAGTPSPGNGGGIHISGITSTTINGGTFSGNVAAREGGALWNQAGSQMNLLNNVVLTNNTARGSAADDGGGGIFNNGGVVGVRDSFIVANTANGLNGSGGGVLNLGGSFLATATLIAYNTASRAGGGIEDVAGQSELNQVNLSNNRATTRPGNGGGLHITGAGQVTINGGQVSSNFAAAEGGGLWNSSTGILTVNGVTISQNSSPIGGGLFNDSSPSAGGTLAISSSTVSRNSATLSGAGIFSEDGQVSIQTSTISGNNSLGNGGGIGIRAGTLSLQSVTIANNAAATSGGGVLQLNASLVESTNSLIARNSAAAGPDSSGVLTSGGNNLIGNTSGVTILGATLGNLVDVNPVLGPLANNGGPTQTHALLAGSPAINAGTPAGLNFDQRGVPRPQAAIFDIGSFEVDSASGESRALSPTARADVSRDRIVSALDVLLIVNAINSVDASINGSTPSGESRTAESRDPLDVNRDGIISGLDALLVINMINVSNGQVIVVSDAPAADPTEIVHDMVVDFLGGFDGTPDRKDRPGLVFELDESQTDKLVSLIARETLRQRIFSLQ